MVVRKEPTDPEAEGVSQLPLQQLGLARCLLKILNVRCIV